MVTSPPIVDDEPVEITHITPVDVSGVRDPGMRALVLLAASLGWNVIQKVNNPVALVARDGVQRRLPTNTSIRMSVFQSALSTIMVHTEDRVATPELIDAIVAATRVDRDHERRLRLAIGESAKEHRQRLANEKVAEQKRQPDEHLTYRPVLTDAEVAAEADPAEELVSFEPPVDGQNHGGLMSRQPFIAHYGVNSSGTGTSVNAYVSDSSFERIWQDGFIDYECPICGRVFASSRGAGSHRQVHIKSGEIPKTDKPAWMRALEKGATVPPDKAPPVRQKTKRRTKAEMAEQVVPALDEIVFEELPPEVVETSTADFGVDEDLPPINEFGDIDYEPEEVIDQIAALVAPRIMTDRDKWRQMARDREDAIKQLQRELATAVAELEKARADWDALRGLIDGR